MREPTVAVAPVSAMTSGSSSEDLARMAAAASRMRALRSSTDQAAHPGWASLAAAAAASGVVRAGVGGQPDDLLGGGVDDLVGPVGRVDPLAPDEELVLVALGGLGHVCSRLGCRQPI